MKEIIYENYNIKEATDFLHKLFHNRKGTKNIDLSMVMSFAYLKRPFKILFKDEGVYAEIDHEAFLIYEGNYDLDFEE